MSEHRKHKHAICLKTEAKTEVKFELFPAEQWEDGVAGLFRIRRNDRWIDGPDGSRLFFTLEAAGRLTATALGGETKAPAAPLMPGDWVRLDGCQTRVKTKPLRALDGRDYVVVSLFGQGAVWVPTEDLQLVERLHVERHA